MNDNTEKSERSDLIKQDLPTSCLQSKYLGFVLGITACTVAAGSDAIKKLVMKSIGAVELMCIRNVFILIVYICVFKFKKVSVNMSWKSHIMVILGSIFKACVPYMRCIALKYISLVESTTFMFTNLIYTGPISFLCLALPLGFFDAGSILTCILGTLLVCHPAFMFRNDASHPSDPQRPLGIGLAISATFLSTLNTYAIRHVQEAPVSYLMILQTSFGLVFGVVAFVAGQEKLTVPTDGKTWALILGMLAIIFIYSTLETFSNRMVETHEYSVVQTTELPASFLFQVLLFHEFPSALEFAGSLLILFAVVAYAFKNVIMEKAEKYFSCINNSKGKSYSRLQNTEP